MVLEGMIHELGRYEGLLATSMFMMPRRPERRRRIYEAVLNQGASLHFVLEDMIVRKLPDVEPIEEILSIHNLLPEAPKTLSDKTLSEQISSSEERDQ
jgi:sporadic carbohydrate cluster protein (TIGR04323 family)